MKSFLIILVLVCFAISAEAKRKKLPYETEDEPPVQLEYTHLLPSTSVIPSGTLVLGTTMGVGILDIFELTTNLYLDLAQVFNISTKVHLFRNEDFGVAAFATYTSQSIQVFDGVSSYNTRTYSSLAPGLVVSYYILPQLTGHTGFTYTAKTPSLSKADFQTSRNGFVQGNVVNQEVTFGLSRTLAVSSGVSYDLSYDVFGAGASVHLGGFQLGGHYYFNVQTGSFLPILGGGYSINY